MLDLRLQMELTLHTILIADDERHMKLYAYIPKPMDLSALKVCVQGALAR
jgi:hypothetical protein